MLLIVTKAINVMLRKLLKLTYRVQLKLQWSDQGLFSGSTVINQSAPSSLFHKERACFGSAEDLNQFLEKFFKNVVVLTTRFPNRENLYFVASHRPINQGLSV